MRAMQEPSLDRLAAYGPLPLRLFAGVFLVFMSQDNVFDRARMHEFELFLGKHGFPVPALAAPVSVYAQFIAGICYLLGLWVRPAAAVMVINFVVALVGVHMKLPFRAALEPTAMLATACALLLLGAGALSLDDLLRRRQPALAGPTHPSAS